MKRIMKRNQKSERLRMWGFLWLVAAGCSMADAPSSAPPPEFNVAKYYIPVAAQKMHYEYSVASNAPFHPASGTLAMDMHGIADTFQGIPVYSCEWTYANYGSPAEWFYALDSNHAINLGIEPTPDGYTDHWVDLQAPLKDSAIWNFTSQGEHITATITKYGASAQVEGTTYNDVLMVQYVGDSGTTGT